MKKSILVNSIICAGVAFAASAYGADTLLDTFGPVNGAASLYGYPGAAMSFSTGASAEQLTDVQLGMDNNGGAGSVTVDLYSSTGPANSPKPGTLLDTLSIFPNSDLAADTIVPLSDNPTLAANTMYWIGLSGGGIAAAWNFTSAAGPADEYFYNGAAYSDSYGPWEMEVQGTPVTASAPDAASTAALLGLSIGGLVVLRRKLSLVPAAIRP